MMLRRICIILAPVLALMTGCGGDDDVVSGGGMPVFNSQPAQQAAAPQSTQYVPTEDEYGLASGLEGPREFRGEPRDPFERLFPEQPEEISPLIAAEIELPIEPVVRVDRRSLADHPIESCQLIGIVTRRARKVALFMIPDGDNRAVLAYINDPVGPNGTGRITDIQADRVIVRYEGYGSAQGHEVEITLPNPAAGIDAEFVEF